VIRFVEVVNNTNFNSRHERTAVLEFSLGEVWINQNHVVNLREATGYSKLLQEGRLPADLDSAHGFTAITAMVGAVKETYVVVGTLDAVAKRLSRNTATLLKG